MVAAARFDHRPASYLPYSPITISVDYGFPNDKYLAVPCSPSLFMLLLSLPPEVMTSWAATPLATARPPMSPLFFLSSSSGFHHLVGCCNRKLQIRNFLVETLRLPAMQRGSPPRHYAVASTFFLYYFWI